MAHARHRVCASLLLLAAAALLLSCTPLATSSELEEWDLFAARELLQTNVRRRSRSPPRYPSRSPPRPPPTYYPPKNDTKPPCTYMSATYRPKLGAGHQRSCRGRCTWNCYSAVWKCFNCRKRRSGCRNTEHSYTFTDGCREVDYDDRSCGRMFCKGYGR